MKGGRKEGAFHGDGSGNGRGLWTEGEGERDMEGASQLIVAGSDPSEGRNNIDNCDGE